MDGSSDQDFMRLVMAIILVAGGLGVFIWPDSLWDFAGSFRRTARILPPFERLRLTRVIAAREKAEGISEVHGRILGIAAVFFAGLAAVRSVPVIVPYVLLRLACALVMLFVYARFNRATQRRAAPLIRRSPLGVISPLVVASVACSLAVTLSLVVYPQLRFGATIVAASIIVLAFIGWRVAGAPALLLGADLQLEREVDDRLRAGRATGIAGLACALSYLFVGLAGLSVPHHDFFAINLLAWAAFMVTILVNFVLTRRRIQLT
jgi:hypothetical protein